MLLVYEDVHVAFKCDIKSLLWCAILTVPARHLLDLYTRNKVLMHTYIIIHIQNYLEHITVLNLHYQIPFLETVLCYMQDKSKFWAINYILLCTQLYIF